MTDPAEPDAVSGPSGSGNKSNLVVRAISTFVLAPLALAITWYGGLPFYGLAIVVAGLIFYEWGTVTGQFKAPLVPIIICGGMLVGLVAIILQDAPNFGFVFLAGAFLAAAIYSMIQRAGFWLPTGVLYAAPFAIALWGLRSDEMFGLMAVIFLFAVIWATDIGAYLVGRTIGGPKLWPAVSPGKTWSGALGGLAGGVLAGVGVIYLSPHAVGLAIVAVSCGLSIISQFGDLFESAVKRRFGVKDSGHIIPGHGGIMDRVDGLIFAAIFAAAIGCARGGSSNIGEGLLIW